MMNDKEFEKFVKEMTRDAEVEFAVNTSFYNKAQLIKALQFSKACNSDIDTEVMDHYIKLLNEEFINIK